jgi:hypothetical protein
VVPGTPDGCYEEIDPPFEEIEYVDLGNDYPCDMEPLVVIRYD